MSLGTCGMTPQLSIFVRPSPRVITPGATSGAIPCLGTWHVTASHRYVLVTDAECGHSPRAVPNQRGADDRRTDLVSDGMVDILSLCSVYESSKTTGRVDATKASLCAAQTTEASQAHRRLLAESRCVGRECLEAGTVGEGVVAQIGHSSGQSSDEHCLVQASRCRDLFSEVC
jgi:hypothetical protein